MRIMMVSLLLCGAALAQDADNKVLELWKAYEQASKATQDASKEASAKYRKAIEDGEDRAEALKEYRGATKDLREKQNDALDAFRTAFAKSDWSAWDAEEHAAMLESGLSGTARNATKDGKFDLAHKAWSALLKSLPDSRGAKSAKIQIGDILCATGSTEAGIKMYQEAREEAQKRMDAAEDDRTKKSEERGLNYAVQRLSLVGKPAPDIDSKNWIGGDAAKLSDLKGKVVVIDFWATWCGPCRKVMPGLSEMYEENKEHGLVVMGVTRFYANGYLPANEEQMNGGGGESVRDMDEEQYQEHLTAFKKNTKIAYPFVVGEKEDFTNYKVRGIPTVAVIDTKGNVALLVVGSGSEPLIKAVVERELKTEK